jgi:hypothetical protein
MRLRVQPQLIAISPAAFDSIAAALLVGFEPHDANDRAWPQALDGGTYGKD